MIQILKYGEVPNSRIFARVTPKADVSAIVAEILADVRENGDKAVADAQLPVIEKNYKYFGYGYFDNVEEALPNVPITFYMFHLMVILGGFLLAVIAFKFTFFFFFASTF